MDKVCHFEIPYDDKSRSEKFYTDVFGWQITDAPGEKPYTFCITTPVDQTMTPAKPGGINGGMYQRGDGGSKTPVVVIEVDSCEQRVKDVLEAGGGHIFGPEQVGHMGIYAQVKDTEGNIIGLWQPLGH